MKPSLQVTLGALIGALLGLGGCVDDLPELAPCTSPGECGAGRGCGFDGVCRQACANGMQCSGPEVCVLGVCQIPQCREDDECGQGEVCNRGACVPPMCREDEDCVGEMICEEGLCAPEECEDDSDCEADEGGTCVDHRCVGGGRDATPGGDAAPPRDAAPPADLGAGDAGVADAGASDAGATDAGPDLDVGMPDAAVPDAGATDAAPPDALVDDAAPGPDAGVVDPLALLPLDPMFQCTLEAYDPFDDGEPSANPNGFAGAPSVIGAAAQLSEAAGILSLTAPAAGGAYGLRWPGGLLPLGGQIGVRVTRLDLADDADTALEVGFTYTNNGQLSGHQGLWVAAVLVPTGTPGEFRLRVDQRGPDGTVTEGTPSDDMIALASAPLPLDVVFEAGMEFKARLHRANGAHGLVAMARADNLLGVNPQPGGPNAYPAVQLRTTGEDGPVSLAWMVAVHCIPPAMVP